MACTGEFPVTSVDLLTDIDDAPWMNGELVRPPVARLEYLLEEDRPGYLQPMYAVSVPIMAADLLQVILAAGVDNLQFFPAVVRDPLSGEEHTDYYAFNILGKVAAADLGRSRTMHDLTITGLDRDFSSLVLDQSAIPKDLLMFRLAESVNAIVVHPELRARIEASDIEGMVFYEVGEWAG